MKSRLLLLLLLTSTLTSFTIVSFAQDNPFIGKWKLKGIPDGTGLVLNKVFDENGEFANYRTTPAGTLKTHYGKYKIIDKYFYQEAIGLDAAPGLPDLAGIIGTIQYKFSEDKKTLSLKGLATGNNSAWQEEWKKVEDQIVASNYTAVIGY